MESFGGLIAPTVRAAVNFVEKAMRRIGDGELRAEQLGARPEIDECPVGLETAADVRAPAVAEIDPAREPLLARWRGRLPGGRIGWRGRVRWLRRCGDRLCRRALRHRCHADRNE